MRLILLYGILAITEAITPTEHLPLQQIYVLGLVTILAVLGDIKELVN